jgi:hypothetical protein
MNESRRHMRPNLNYCLEAIDYMHCVYQTRSDYFISRDHRHGLVYHRGPMDLRSRGCTGLLNGRTSRVISYFRRRLYDEAIALGYIMVPSKSASYWLTQCTTRDLVDDIIAPYSLTSREALLMTSPGRQTYFGVI